MPTTEIRVRVNAGARHEAIQGLRNGAIVVRVSAPALDGRANKALRRLFASELGVAPSKVEIVRGARSREKLVRVDGLDQATVRAALKV